MHFFFMRLNPPRSTFAQDMTPEERSVMMAHVEYWRVLMQKGTALIFGPVADPAGSWGLGVIQTEDPNAQQQISAADPALTIGMSYDIFPMPRAIFGAALEAKA